MSRVLVLAKSGFGKSTSIGNIPELEIQGLNPETTYIISVTSKPLPFKGSGKIYPISESVDRLSTGRRFVTNDPLVIEKILNGLAKSPIENVVLDDTNYIMQDWYMDNALSKGWDAPKTIGYNMNKIFKAMEGYQSNGKNLFVLAHGEDVLQPDGRIYTKMKTTGKMVDEYVTPEGKFDITLVGVSRYDTSSKEVKREFLTNENEQYSSAKSPIGMFNELLIPNDLGLVVKKIKEYYE